jgi:hypothetical protein
VAIAVAAIIGTSNEKTGVGELEDESEARQRCLHRSSYHRRRALPQKCVLGRVLAVPEQLWVLDPDQAEGPAEGRKVKVRDGGTGNFGTTAISPRPYRPTSKLRAQWELSK